MALTRPETLPMEDRLSAERVLDQLADAVICANRSGEIVRRTAILMLRADGPGGSTRLSEIERKGATRAKTWPWPEGIIAALVALLILTGIWAMMEWNSSGDIVMNRYGWIALGLGTFFAGRWVRSDGPHALQQPQRSRRCGRSV